MREQGKSKMIQWFSNTKNKAKKINTLIVIAIVGW